jgi:G3E family GTPase
MSVLQSETLSMLTGIFEAARLSPARTAAQSNVLPLTVISGFLGAGKTTLLNRLLSEPQGRRLAVLVNDFGNINIDAALIKSRSEDAISLANGCACCTVAGDLTRALIKLSDSPEPPDAIILEASGLADPRGIAQVALANPALYLDGVLTLVDGETFEERHNDPDLASIFSAQLSAADIIVLNKVDLLGTRGRAVRDHLQELAGKRPVLEVAHADVPADVVLGVRTQQSVAMACLPDEDHSSVFRSWSRVWSNPLGKERLTNALEQLPADIIRAKGIFHFSDNPSQRFIYQRVGPRWKLTPDDAPRVAAPGVSQESSLVVIGPSSKFDVDFVSERFTDGALA